jgi:hypothetical protein
LQINLEPDDRIKTSRPAALDNALMKRRHLIAWDDQKPLLREVLDFCLPRFRQRVPFRQDQIEWLPIQRTGFEARTFVAGETDRDVDDAVFQAAFQGIRHQFADAQIDIGEGPLISAGQVRHHAVGGAHGKTHREPTRFPASGRCGVTPRLCDKSKNLRCIGQELMSRGG